MAAFLAVARPLFWLVVKRRALVNNMNRYELEGLVAYHLECSGEAHHDDLCQRCRLVSTLACRREFQSSRPQ